MVAATVANSAMGALRPSIAAIAAALPTGGASMQSIIPCARPASGWAKRTRPSMTRGTPKVVQTSMQTVQTGRSNSLRKEARSTFKKAPSVKTNTANPSNGRAASASVGATKPISTPTNRIKGPLRPANANRSRPCWPVMAQPPEVRMRHPLHAGALATHRSSAPPRRASS
jgi:hypothetical protein